MEFVETSIFSKIIGDFLSEDEYGRLQMMLSIRPDLGKVIQGSGGLRKLRWTSSGRGKRGGTRIIYYWYVQDEQIFLLYVYKKSAAADLTKEQVRVFRRLIEEDTNEK